MNLGENAAHMIGHNGGAPGVDAELNIYPATGYVVTVLANIDPPAAEEFARFIGERLPKN